MTKNMTSGKTLKLILLFSVPVLIGNIFQQFYNMVDAIIVGQFIGEDALAAVGSSGSVVFFVLGFAMGIANGFGVIISHAFGANDRKRLKHYVAMCIMLGVIITVVMTLLTVPFSRSLLILMKTPANILDDANAYISIIFMGLGTSLFYNIAASILRGIGDSKTPLYFLIVSSILNIALDLYFIIGLHMGPEGAALATVIAQGVAALLCFIYMFRKFEILKLTRSCWSFQITSAIKLLRIGIPMAINYSVTAIGVMILQSAINILGSTVVAAYTAACKVEQLATQPMVTLGTTMATFCGQNLGAGKYDRIFDGMRKALYISFTLAGFASFVSVLLGPYMVKLFLSDASETVLSYATQYLNTIAFFYIPLVFIYFYRNALQGLDQGLMPMISGGIEMVVRVGVVLFLTSSFGYTAVCLASPFAWIGAAIPLLIYYLRWEKKQKNRLLLSNH